MLCFKRETGIGGQAVVALTLPKAGTYLIAEVLKGLGLIDAEVHLGLDSLTDYRDMTVDRKIAEGRSRGRDAPVEVSAGLIRPGQFAVGHIVHNWRSARSLRPHRKILMTRGWRDCLASFMRFEGRRIALDPERFPEDKARWTRLTDGKARQVGFLRAFGAEHTDVARAMIGWRAAEDVLAVRFEDLLGDSGPEKQRASVIEVADHLGLSHPDHPLRLLESCLGTATLTFSGRRTRVEDSWSDEAEALFVELGGNEVDAAFGN